MALKAYHIITTTCECLSYNAWLLFEVWEFILLVPLKSQKLIEDPMDLIQDESDIKFDLKIRLWGVKERGLSKRENGPWVLSGTVHPIHWAHVREAQQNDFKNVT